MQTTIGLALYANRSHYTHDYSTSCYPITRRKCPELYRPRRNIIPKQLALQPIQSLMASSSQEKGKGRPLKRREPSFIEISSDSEDDAAGVESTAAQLRNFNRTIIPKNAQQALPSLQDRYITGSATLQAAKVSPETSHKSSHRGNTAMCPATT
jgi:hypothetical protein